MRRGPYSKARLAPLQLDIIRLLADGFTARQIAKQLRMGEKTVKNYCGAIYRRLDARNAVHAVSICYREGLLAGADASRERLHALADTLRDALADIEQLKHLDDAAGDLP